MLSIIFFFNDTATTEIYTLSLHDALPISTSTVSKTSNWSFSFKSAKFLSDMPHSKPDRKSTRLNSSHLVISYAVFCLKKKTIRLQLHYRKHCEHHRCDE